MSFIEHKKEIFIKTDIHTLSDFLKDVSNLPLWTEFFLEVLKRKNKFFVSTKIGNAQTSIKRFINQTEHHLTISSYFEKIKKKEKAKIILREDSKGTCVSFFLYLPIILEPDQLNKQLETLNNEMIILKRIFEGR